MFTEPVHSRAAVRDATAARIIAAAATLFDQRGFDATTVRDIAKAADVSAGRVMAVADKRGLLVLVVDGAIRRMGEAQARTMNDQADANPEGEADAVMAVLRPFLEFFATHLDTARSYAGILISGNHRSAIFDQLAIQLTEQLATALREREHTAELARLIHRAYLGELFLWAGSGATTAEHALAELRRSVTFILAEGTTS